MDTVKQRLPQSFAKTNIVPADGASGLEREREGKGPPLQSPPLSSAQ